MTKSFEVSWFEESDADALSAARGFANGAILNRASLHGSLEQPELRKRSRLLEVRRAGVLCGVGALIDGVFPFRSGPIDTTLTGAASAAVAAMERPFGALVREPLWGELERLGGSRVIAEVQMVRLLRVALPDPDPRVKRVSDRAEFASVGRDVSPVHFDSGPFFAIREGGAIVSMGGVLFATGRLAQLGYVWTREDRRGAGLARAVTVELIRALEADGNTLLLHVGEENSPARALYADLGFRGRQRLAVYAMG